MSIYQGTGLAEGASVTRPPLFDGTNYSYWKNRMCTYLKSMDFEQWKVTTLGDYEITKINENGVKGLIFTRKKIVVKGLIFTKKRID